MAIATLVPTIRVCISNNNTTLRVYDTTSQYAAENTGGWGSPNSSVLDITAATLTYTTPGGTTATNSVLTVVNAQAATTGEFLLGEYTITPEDGQFDFNYTVTASDGTVTADLAIFWLGSVRCCIDKLWAKHAQHLIDNVCACTGKSTPYDIQAVEAESIYGAIRHGVSCANTVERDKLLKKLQRICKLNKCNC